MNAEGDTAHTIHLNKYMLLQYPIIKYLQKNGPHPFCTPLRFW